MADSDDGRTADDVDQQAGDSDDGRTADDVDQQAGDSDDGRHLDAHGDVADPVEVGVELLANLEFESLSVAAAIDRLETVTTHPRKTREILEVAEDRGVIDRESGDVYPQGGGYVSFQSDVITKDGEFSCRRCGATISTGYFINFESGELGAFGSSCIRKVTGRE